MTTIEGRDREIAKVRVPVAVCADILVGPHKPMGYLPLDYLAEWGLNVDEVAAAVTEDGTRRTHLFSAEQCRIASGALYAYAPADLQLLLNEHVDLLFRNGWPPRADWFVVAVASVTAVDPDLNILVARAFGAERTRDFAERMAAYYRRRARKMTSRTSTMDRFYDPQGRPGVREYGVRDLDERRVALTRDLWFEGLPVYLSTVLVPDALVIFGPEVDKPFEMQLRTQDTEVPVLTARFSSRASAEEEHQTLAEKLAGGCSPTNPRRPDQGERCT